MTRPIHSILMAGRMVRFYASPLDGPDWAWVAFCDVLAVAQIPKPAWDHWIGRWRQTYPAMISDLPDGTAIVPDPAAQGLFMWGIEAGWSAGQDLLEQFQNAAADLFCKLHAHASREEFLNLVQQAGLRNTIVVPGVTYAH